MAAHRRRAAVNNVGDIHPGLKSPTLAGVHDDAHLGIGGQCAPRHLELVPHPSVHRVQLLGPVVDEPTDRAAALEPHRWLAANLGLSMRIGLHSGPLVAGVIGTHKFAYDVWGDTVNIAARVESLSLPGRIQVSAACARLLLPTHILTRRGLISVKGKGTLETYFLESRRTAAAPAGWVGPDGRAAEAAASVRRPGLGAARLSAAEDLAEDIAEAFAARLARATRVTAGHAVQHIAEAAAAALGRLRL